MRSSRENAARQSHLLHATRMVFALFDYPTLVTVAYVLNCFQNVISKTELI